MTPRSLPLVLALVAAPGLGCTRSRPRDDGARDARAPEEVRPPAAATPAPAPAAPAVDEYARKRERMVRDTIEAEGVKDPQVLAALRKVPRHLFVPEVSRHLAYSDRPLPIGHGQTISQPYIVAFMTEAVAPKKQDKCLEIGTGSGYQAAVLAELCQKVFSIEYVPELAELGKKQLREAGYAADRVELRTGDGYRGWPEAAPFQVIVVTAAPPKVPAPLKEQLAVGGRMVIPVGENSGAQTLELWTKKKVGGERGAFEVKELLPVRFVPFVGEAAER